MPLARDALTLTSRAHVCMHMYTMFMYTRFPHHTTLDPLGARCVVLN